MTGWLAEPGVEPGSIAVLARVNSLLLAPHVALHEAGVPSAVGASPDVLDRTGLAGRACLPADRRLARADRGCRTSSRSCADRREGCRRGSLTGSAADRVWTVRALRRIAATRAGQGRGQGRAAWSIDIELVHRRGRRAARPRRRPARRARRRRSRPGHGHARPHRIRSGIEPPRRSRGAAAGGGPAPRPGHIRDVAPGSVPTARPPRTASRCRRCIGSRVGSGTGSSSSASAAASCRIDCPRTSRRSGGCCTWR